MPRSFTQHQYQEHAMASSQIGTAAPRFSVPDQNGRIISNDDLRGRWAVIYFYPKDDTPGCTVEACEFTSGLEGFETVNARVLGVSADSPQSHLNFIAKYNLKIDLLSDESKSLSQAFGVLVQKQRDGETYMGVSRQTFVIDPEGRIVYHWPQVTAAGHAEQVRQKLVELQA
jgi:thioredoxin-dependent peroxiredoxin